MRTAGLGLLLVLLAGPGFARQRPSVSVTLTEDSVPAATVTIRGLLTDQVVNALESGFPLYVQVHVALREPGGLFGGRVAQQADWDYVVLRDPVRDRYAIEEPDTSRTVSRDSLAYYVSRPLLFELEPGRPGQYFYQVRLQARTLSDREVDEAFAWLNGGDNVQVARPGFFTRAARRFLVRVMPLPSFEIEQRSEIFAYGRRQP